ncbi:MAG: sugar phosphate isomerase/epimerase [Acidobacteria bacterium]|nr:sugar phosphate isomerase/epimerase [Acidobacteriota bacterium]
MSGSIQDRISRRDALRAGAAAALTLPLAEAAQKNAAPVAIGMATTEFRKHSNSQLAKELRQAGIRRIQLFLTQTDSRYWRYNERSDLSGLTAERCAAIADTYRSAGMSIHSIGVYANLIHPDESERKANLAYFEAMIKIGGYMGVRTFASEAGHYRPKPPQAPIEGYHWQEDVWRRMVATGKELARIAGSHGATVLLEPHFMSFLATAKRTRVFLEEVGSQHVGAVLDPANLLEANDLEEMFGQLQPWIGCFHAKDRKLHVIRGVGAGEGDLDYRKFVTQAAARKPGVPLFLEYVGADTYRQALAHLRNAIHAAGLREG